ncbi:hypothetical protein BKA70DRAFT_1441489 [Coprinopsis sp. MPI-PUGE-AT-0042]|nr:hypothetical protein BKA70DRAFT_1441489 [Coprinopsis sp. MPI-PUGE-AT-0042]
MSTYPTGNPQSPEVVLQYPPQAPDNRSYASPQLQNSTTFQSHTNAPQSNYSPYTPQQNLMTHNHPTQNYQVAGVDAGAPQKLDPGATPRLESALRCLYATLSFSIPIYILQITTLFEPGGSLWLLPVALMATLIFSSTVVMVTFRDRARMYPNSTKPPPALPCCSSDL